MERPATTGRMRRVLSVLLAAGALVLAGAAPAALARPVPAPTTPPLPTVDPAAPTPTAPYPGRPPQGHAPDGGTVGGPQLATRGTVVADDAPPPPAEVAAAGWLVADVETGEVLGARDPHGRYYPASTLKTLTFLTVAPLLDPGLVVTGTPEDEQVEGSRVGLVAGGQYPVSLLLTGLMLQSGNDAANALARAAGGVDATLAAMNDTARHLGAFDTVAGTPSGLDVAGQSSSPYDLALIFRALLEDPVAAAVLRTPTAQMPAVPGRSPGYQIQNQNPLLASYPGNLGGKTGFTDAARHTFVTAAERDGRRLVVSVMQTENRPLRAAEQAALLLDWGFAVPASARGVGHLVGPGEIPETPPAASPTSAAAPGTVAAPAAPAASDAGFPVLPTALAVGGLVLAGGTALTLRRPRAGRVRPGGR